MNLLALSTVTNSVIVGGLALGGLYALIAVGFSVIYTATRAVNFAQGAFALVGAYLYWTFADRVGTGRVVAVAAVVVCCALLGIGVYAVLLRRMAGADEFIVIIFTLGLSLVVTAVVATAYGLNTHYIRLTSTSNVDVIGLSFSLLQMAALVVSVVAIVAIVVLSRVTRWGVVMKAVAENPLLGGCYGINVDAVGAGAWALGTVLSGVAGVVFAAQTGLTQDVGNIGLVAFPAIMLGGMDSVGGGIVGGLVVGFAVTFVTTQSNPTIADLSAYGLLLLVILIRPQGFFGSRVARSV